MKYQIMIGIAALGLFAGCASNKSDDMDSASTQASVNATGASVDARAGSAEASVKADTEIKEGAGASAGPKVGTKLSDLPDAVQKAIMSRSPNAKIDDIDKETRSGRTVYEIQFEEPGQNPKLHIAEDGTFVDGE